MKADSLQTESEYLAPGQTRSRRRGRTARPLHQAIRNVKKLLRTLQVHFPSLLDTKFRLMRFYRNALKLPFEYDFDALSLFPDTGPALFLDVGANRGQSTDAILMNRKNARIHLFEPNEVLCAKLERMFRDDERIVLNHYGLGDETSEGVLVVPVYKRWMFDGLGSFNRSEAANWLKGRMFFYDGQCLTLHESRSRIRTLDELGLAPFFIKLDIQGYEYKALLGGERTIRKHEPVLLIESPDERTIEYLKRRGYDYYVFRRGRFVPRIVGTPNTFFMTEAKADLVRRYIEPLVSLPR